MLLTLTDAKPVKKTCSSSSSSSSDEEEVIRCVCNIYRDEGKMIQCESCEVRQLSTYRCGSCDVAVCLAAIFNQ